MTIDTNIEATPRSTELVLEARGIVKRYGRVVALDETDFEIRAGEVLAVIGDNGAGKSSLIKCLSGAMSPDEGEIWFRRPQSVYRVARSAGRLEFLYKVVGRGTKGLATLKPGDNLNMLGPLGVGFTLEPGWKNVVVLGRGVGLATMAPISQLAGERGVRVTAILSARSEELAMAADLFESVGTVIKVLDTDGSSAVENVEKILRRLIAEKKADAFFTCGSNRLMQLMKRLGKEHAIPGQMAMEQIMACGLGPCYICVRTFEVNGKREMRRVCIEGPVFDLQECLGW